MVEASPQHSDHQRLDDTQVSRRYLAGFAAITGHLGRVAAQLQVEGRLTPPEIDALARYLVALNLTFRALGYKYHFAGRHPVAGSLTFDKVDSGFPVFSELLEMANDAQQAEQRLQALATVDALKDEMVRQILADLVTPTRLQYAVSQRLYYRELQKGGLFWARNDPEAVWLETSDQGAARRRYLLRWAVYDSSVNLPTIYLMEVEDTGRTGLPKDARRWPEVQAHLMAQSIGGLKLVTIATGFDKDFEDLHPKRLRRFHIGPMYSAAFTVQAGPIHEVLEKARGGEDEDWALVWTEEDLVSERVEQVRSGWFGTEEQQIFALDPFAGTGADSGVTRMDRFVMLPERPYQALSELNPPGFAGVRKFVIGAGDRVLSYR